MPLAFATLWSCSQSQSTTGSSIEASRQEAISKARTIITTDGEVDDIDSFIRMLLYANEFEIEGLVYSSSQWHYAGDGKGTTFISEMPNTRERYGERTSLRWPGTDWMELLLDKYEAVHANLIMHDPAFPTAARLRSLVRVGNIDFEGEMDKRTEGADLIVERLLDDDPRPIYLQAWGGTNTIARALKNIEEDYRQRDDWPEIKQRVSEKSIIYIILDQDATYRKYIAAQWPDVRVIYNEGQFWSFAYAWHQRIPGQWLYYMEGPFLANEIIRGHGPLTAEYYAWGDGRVAPGEDDYAFDDPQQAAEKGRKQYDFISEGDSPAYLYLVDNGLRSKEDPVFGGWGGRFSQSPDTPAKWADDEEAYDFNPFQEKLDPDYAQTRWIPAIQNDFAARADWCVKRFEEANHAPIVQVAEGTDIIASAGETVSLTAEATDPDGDKLSYHWWQYHEADSYIGRLSIPAKGSPKIEFVVPKDAMSDSDIHLICEVKDEGEPVLTGYRRVIVRVADDPEN